MGKYLGLDKAGKTVAILEAADRTEAERHVAQGRVPFCTRVGLTDHPELREHGAVRLVKVPVSAGTSVELSESAADGLQESFRDLYRSHGFSEAQAAQMAEIAVPSTLASDKIGLEASLERLYLAQGRTAEQAAAMAAAAAKG